MLYFQTEITSDFKNSTKRNNFKAEMFFAQYGNDNHFKMFFDREDGRRVVVKMSEEEMIAFNTKLTNQINSK